MKLYSVRMWDINPKNEGSNKLVIVASESDAEDIAMENEYYDCYEAEEVKEFQGYKIIFEKILP